MTSLDEIRLDNFRCHDQLTLSPGDTDWVVLSGANGAGKTSVLEALYSAARGRSFRSTSLSDLIAHNQNKARVFIRSSDTRKHTLGMEIQPRKRLAHLDGAACDLAGIAEAVPVEYLGGDTMRLVQASPAERRRFMDWTLFHVEPRFLSAWRQWYRAHRQRNALLKSGAPTGALLPWTEAVAQYGEKVSAYRAHLLDALQDALVRVGASYTSGLQLEFRAGWRGDSLLGALEASAARETQQGRAVVGPQHDDWSLTANGAMTAELSRGQAKLVSLLLYRCQALLMQDRSRTPVYLMDDLAADLDSTALAMALDLWANSGLQVWVTMLAEGARRALPGVACRFHVEHGRSEEF